MVTLGIETSCDETAAAIIDKRKILSNIISSSVPLHEKYGGVIPEVASRFHVEYINRVTSRALKQARKKPNDIELISVTASPGLPGSLVVGKSFARALSYSLEVPLIEIDHLAAHLYVNFLSRPKVCPRFPYIGVLVSGGHTNIFLCRSFKDMEIIGRTRDDAVGEAFDKVARILGIGYPGGPKIEKYAKRFFVKKPIEFPRAFLGEDSFDFSLSGVKTAVFYYARQRRLSAGELSRICWSFQEAVFDVLVEKTLRACKKFSIDEILLGGGVVSNGRLRKKLKSPCKRLKFKLFFPPASLCVDNAAMVAGLGEELFKKGG
jgi:N6-L-threonylcarbamoyladenine synthase